MSHPFGLVIHPQNTFNYCSTHSVCVGQLLMISLAAAMGGLICSDAAVGC